MLFPAIVVVIVLSIIICDYKNGRNEKEILSYPVYVEATITKIVPDTPSKLGVVNIEVDYVVNGKNDTTCEVNMSNRDQNDGSYWPGRFVEHGHGEYYARIRQERWQVEHQQIQATATAMGIAPGHTFALCNAPFFSDNGEYLTTEANYFQEENRYASGSDGERCTAPISP